MTETTKKTGKWLELMVGAGAWSLPFILASLFLHGAWAERAALLFYALALGVNFPHYAAALTKAYGSAKDIKKNSFRRIWGTALVVAALIYVVINPVELVLLFTLFLVWAPWHYSAQNHGIAQYFLKKADVDLTVKNRRLFQLGFVFAYFSWVLGLQTGFSSPLLLSLHLDETWVTPLRVLLGLGFIFAVVPTILQIRQSAAEKNRAKKSAVSTQNANAVIWVTAAQGIWFLLPWLVNSLRHIEVSPLYFVSGAMAFMHAAQSLWFHLAVENQKTKQDKSKKHALKVLFFSWMGMGSALFFLGPMALSHGFQLDFAVLLLAFQAAVNVHHFLIEGSCWDAPALEELFVRKADSFKSLAAEKSEEAAPLPLVLAASGALLLVGVLGVAQFIFTTANAPMEWVEWAARLNPADKRVDLRFAEDLARSNQIDNALESLVTASEQSAGNADVQLSTVRLLALKGRYEEAYALLAKQPEHFRDRFSDDVHLAALAVELNRFADAKSWLKKALKKEPENPEVFRHYALLARKQGDDVDLVNAVQKRMQLLKKWGVESVLTQKNPDAENAVLLLAASKALREMNRAEEAKEWLPLLVKACIRLNRPDLTLFSQAELARNAKARGKIGEARREFARALEFTRFVDLPVDEGELWMGFGVLLEEARLPVKDRFALLLKAKLAADKTVVHDVDRDLRAVVLKKVTFESMTKMAFALSAEERAEIERDLDFRVEQILKREGR